MLISDLPLTGSALASKDKSVADSQQPSPAVPILTRRRVITISTISAFLAIVLLIDPMIAAVAVGFVWSAGGLMHLNETALLVFSMLVAIPTVWAMVHVAWLAFDAETLGDADSGYNDTRS